MLLFTERIMDPQQFQHELNRMNMQQQNQMVNQQLMNQQQQQQVTFRFPPLFQQKSFEHGWLWKSSLLAILVFLLIHLAPHRLGQGYGSSVHSDDDSDDDDDQSGQKRSRKSGFDSFHVVILGDKSCRVLIS